VRPDPEEFAARFADVADAAGPDVGAVLDALAPRSVGAGEALLVEGRSSEAALFVWEGALRVTLSVEGEDVEVGRFGPGAVIGEASFIDGGAASANVSAAEPSVVLCLSRASFDGLRARSARAAAGILRTMCVTLAVRVRRATARLEELRSGGPVPKPKAGFLEALANLLGSRS
jgi:CRP-like cAMP-binding protein